MFLILTVILLITFLVFCVVENVRSSENNNRFLNSIGIIVVSFSLTAVLFAGQATVLEFVLDGTMLQVESGNNSTGYTTKKNEDEGYWFIKTDQRLEIGKSYIVKGDSLIQVK